MVVYREPLSASSRKRLCVWDVSVCEQSRADASLCVCSSGCSAGGLSAAPLGGPDKRCAYIYEVSGKEI